MQVGLDNRQTHAAGKGIAAVRSEYVTPFVTRFVQDLAPRAKSTVVLFKHSTDQ